MPSALLSKGLEILQPYFSTPGLIELCINQPGEIHLETTTGWISKRDKRLNGQALRRLGHLLATASGQRFDHKVPLLACQIPGLGYRAQFISGSMTDSDIAISIRVGTATQYPIDTYMSESDAQRMIEAIIQRRTILVAGGTSSGKTTFLNNLIDYIPADERVVAIEDTKELLVPHANQVRLLKSKSGSDVAGVTYQDIFNACMRIRPDRLLMGELTIDNTIAYLRLINSGHAGCLSTIHADGTKAAIKALGQNALLSGMQAGAREIESFAEQAIHIIVHLERVSRTSIRATVEYLHESSQCITAMPSY